MNAVADMPSAVRQNFKTAGDGRMRTEARGSFAIGLLVALGIHAGILFGWQRTGIEHAEFGVEMADSSIEVSLVAALPAEEVTPQQPPEPEPEPIAPPPPEPETLPEMALPEPLPPPPRQPPPPRIQSKLKPLARTARVSGDGSSAKPGFDATTAKASADAASARPGYLRNPHPAYPDEARRAGQQGVVQIRVRVNADGSVASASLISGSGFALLDERALSTVRARWSFKPARVGGVAIASEVIVPIRFSLRD